MPKAPASLDKRQAQRHNPLAEDYAPSSPKQKTGKRKSRKSNGEDDEDKYVDSRASRKILQIGQDLADEDQAEKDSFKITASNPAFDFNSRFADDQGEEVDPSQLDEEDAWGDEEEEEIVLDEVDPNDLDLFNRFNPQNDDPILRGNAPEEEQGTDLAALILSKIADFEAKNTTTPGQEPQEIIPEGAVELPAKVVEAFKQVGLLMSRYKSGKIPKLFKKLPTIDQWPILLSITRPDYWTTNAIYAATKIFVSHKPAIVQEFLTEVLLPRIRQDLYEKSKSEKIDPHLYDALRKSLFKPREFFKGILFPILLNGCSQKEARVLASVMTRVTINRDHSGAALYRLCEIAAEQMSVDPESAGSTNICIKALLEKKYALPWQVVDALVFHFLRFKAVDPGAAGSNGVEAMSGLNGPGSKAALASGKLPVIWHQCLLSFAQRYRDAITEDQREALLDLLLVRGHPSIGPEIRRELLAGRGRGTVVDTKMGDGGDDTMDTEF